MPLVSCANVLRSDEDLLLSLSLRITHILSISSSLDLEPAEDDMPPLPVRGDTLSALDVFISGPLKIHISGSMDGRKVSPKAIAESWLANSMAFALRRNASTLGIHDVSDVFLDDKAATILVTTKGAFTSPFDIAGNMPPVALKRFELRVHCGSKTNLPEDTNAGSHGTGVGHSSQHPSILLPSPFSPTPLASYKEAWAKLTDKFLINNMLRRYPLIFGEWKQALESEQAFFPSIARSISNMFIRSPNPSFKLAGQNAFLVRQLYAQRSIESRTCYAGYKSSKRCGLRRSLGYPKVNPQTIGRAASQRRKCASCDLKQKAWRDWGWERRLGAGVRGGHLCRADENVQDVQASPSSPVLQVDRK
ncbi:hypothetical protein BOTBODRAFT_315103 [Botryobasidium botryosum FD-172 SS1]|uniref:Uncharacterized protein n=1 Tax=Botryobasidium botryosum (strain FD-172 SS1) TaxID=930990 RepID=A0A067MYH8_BOTB1|nr:hypothetical protein BOTBODRAFT_315103 [Botryobasidium botryosum FD-172 SS1]